MSSFQGHFVWHELKTTDADAGKLFYQTMVEDIDATIVALEQAGGSVLLEPMDIPNIGRFANPQGTRFALVEPES